MFNTYHKKDGVILLGTTADGSAIVCNATTNDANGQSFNDVYVIVKDTFAATYAEDQAPAPEQVPAAQDTAPEVQPASPVVKGV